jgi:hypothetical protein
MMFSADNNENVQQMFVQAVVLTDKQVCLKEVCYSCRVMDEGERNVSENGVQKFKMAERTSMFTIALFGTVLQKGVWT